MKRIFPPGWFNIKSPNLEIKDFRILLITRGLLTMTLQIQAVIVGWQIYQLKKSALLLGLIGLTEAIPAISMAFFAGHLVDIHKPTKVYRLSLLAILLNTFFIFISVAPLFNLSENLVLSILFVGIFISGAARAFASPSIFSLVSQIVPRNSLSSAAAFNSSVHTFAAIVGPALGGLIYGFAGAVWAFAVPCFLSLLALYMSTTFSEELRNRPVISEREPLIKSIKAGMSFILNHKVLLSTMVLDMFSVLFGGVVAILPIFADKVFNVGAEGLGFLRAAPAIGSVLVTIVLALRPMRSISGSKLSQVILGFGICTILFALTPNYFLALFFLCLTGVFDGISMVIRGTFMQLLTPDNMRGRVSSLSSIFITSSNEIGAFESGLAASLLGLMPSVLFGGSMTLVVVALVAWIVPDLNKTVIES
jgi:MFS family permease